METKIFTVLSCLLILQAPAQSVLFNFDNLPVYSPLPIYAVQGGIIAQLTATGGGYSIQSMTTATVVPVGFSGNFIFPSSVFASDLLVNFSQPLTGFSILYDSKPPTCRRRTVRDTFTASVRHNYEKLF